MKKQVIIFLKNSETLLFQGVSNLSDFFVAEKKGDVNATSLYY